jgi:gamma-glutamylputrescine oxidase
MLLQQEEELTRASYYEASVARPPPGPALAGRITVDVCIVGAGYAGLAAALELAERGYSVAVLEARRVGWGASGRNGGQVIAGYGHAGEDAIEVQFSPADAKRAWDIAMEGLQWLQQRIARHAIDCDYTPGYLSLAVNARKAHALEQRVQHMQQHYGHAQQWIGPQEIGQWVASPRFHAGAFDPASGHLHPLKYALGLAAAARSAGVQIFEHTPATRVARGDKPVVITPQGEVACRFVVLAGNVYLNEFGHPIAPELGPRIMPVGTYIIATEPMARARADALIRQRAAASDTNYVLDYFRLSADHRLLFGGGDTHRVSALPQAAASMRRLMLTVFPQLADLEVTHVWGGFVDITLNQAPDFGRLGSNVYYLQGFSGHGLALAGIAGQLVAQSVAGQAERFDLLARLRHRAFPGGALLRKPALMLGMLYYRLMDLL